LYSATRVNAEIVGQTGKLGVIATGAIADLLVLDRNPLEDLSVLQDQGKHIAAIVKDGNIIKNLL
jgi:imidazolonepropionase-like amidohydrolase